MMNVKPLYGFTIRPTPSIHRNHRHTFFASSNKDPDDTSDPSTSVIGSGSDSGGGDGTKEQYIWDGVVREGAHDDEFEEDDDDVPFMPSATFMMGMAAVPPTSGAIGSVLGKTSVEGDDEDKSSSKKEILSSLPSGASYFGGGRLHERVDMISPEAELEEVGGDSFFLGVDDENNDGDERGELWAEDLEAFGGWDGIVDENAHLDFD
mmetsp:Transcript_29015/g.42777  ORF Transcript_29015/g.42777 Transcript_29015/m.42777 type:complete len:207 (+) Transcript_29015:413-1033(+)